MFVSRYKARRWRFLVCWVVVGVALTVWLFRFVAAEPRCEDKTLTEWLRLADDHSGDNTVAVVRAEAAIKNIGTKAVPALLGMLTAEDSFRNRSARTWNAALEAVLPPAWAWRLKVEEPVKQRLLAMRGFEILSANADAAVPQLTALLHQTNLAFHSTRILADIHTSNALAALTTGLTNASARVRLVVVQSLWFDWESNESESHHLKEKIVALDRDNDDEVAAYVLKTHLKLVDAEQAARIAARSLTDSRVLVQREALFVLLFGPEWAMEAITNCFSSTCPKNRMMATNVILSMNPYRAPEFGVATNGLRAGIFRAYDMRDPREVWR